MFTKLAGFRTFESWRAASGLPSAMHSNDNLPGFRRPAGQRPSPKSALACHWYPIGDEGRLECRWQAEANDATPIDDLAQAVCIENLIRVDDVTEGPAREIPARPRDHTPTPLGRDYFESAIGLFRPVPAQGADSP